MKKTKILIVDDHAVVRMGLASIISLEDDLEVCCEASSGEEAAKLAAALKPDVAICDFVMSGMDGAAATAAIRAASPDTQVLILTTFGSSEDLARAFDAGAVGAVTKDIPHDELVAAIRATARGRRVVSPQIEQTLKTVEPKPRFTERQQEVLDAITRGLSNDDIAKVLCLSKARIKQHIAELYDKLGAANRTEAVAIAIRRHLLKN
ncbi:MAG: response regulator transcription factor [Kiritimatiellae bacterium]|nr:response regulator transcription factor [Kiritimatiellia bacterium]